jgi:hypothetical protein
MRTKTDDFGCVDVEDAPEAFFATFAVLSSDTNGRYHHYYKSSVKYVAKHSASADFRELRDTVR